MQLHITGTFNSKTQVLLLEFQITCWDLLHLEKN